jgi:hypothetical protein
MKPDLLQIRGITLSWMLMVRERRRGKTCKVNGAHVELEIENTPWEPTKEHQRRSKSTITNELGVN